VSVAVGSPGETSQIAFRLSHPMSRLSLLRAEISSALDEFVAV
jgi:hypothetical protein